MTNDDIALGRRLRKAFALADEIGITDEERYDLASYLTGEDTSWKLLDARQLDRILYMLEGYIHIKYMLDDRHQ